MDSSLDRISELQFGLPTTWYHRPDIYELERQRNFGREWHWIGRLDQLVNPGDYVVTDIAGWRVFAMRDRDGVLRAFHNVCHHRAAALVDDGAGHCDVLCRRYHGWTYDAAGRLRQTPDFGDNPAFKKADYGLYPVRVESWRGLVFVNLDSEAGPLGESLGEPVKEAAPHPIED